jgi:hypothetical protein
MGSSLSMMNGPSYFLNQPFLVADAPNRLKLKPYKTYDIINPSF